MGRKSNIDRTVKLLNAAIKEYSPVMNESYASLGYLSDWVLDGFFDLLGSFQERECVVLSVIIVCDRQARPLRLQVYVQEEFMCLHFVDPKDTFKIGHHPMGSKSLLGDNYEEYASSQLDSDIYG